MLSVYTLIQLREIAKQNNLKRYSRLNKSDLINFINSNVTSVDRHLHEEDHSKKLKEMINKKIKKYNKKNIKKPKILDQDLQIIKKKLKSKPLVIEKKNNKLKQMNKLLLDSEDLKMDKQFVKELPELDKLLRKKILDKDIQIIKKKLKSKPLVIEKKNNKLKQMNKLLLDSEDLKMDKQFVKELPKLNKLLKKPKKIIAKSNFENDEDKKIYEKLKKKGIVSSAAEYRKYKKLVEKVGIF